MDLRPNILFLFPDQLRADFLGCYGADFAETPAIDTLAASGVLYERALSMHPLCVPARAALLTGCNAFTTGIFDNGYWLRPDHDSCGMPSWPALLSNAGYHTEAIGKMHFTPWDFSEGFDHRVISEDKRHIHVQDDYADYLAENGLRKLRGWEEEGYEEFRMASVSPIPSEHQIDNWVGREAVSFIENYQGEAPFACMVAFPGPHDPYNPPAEWAGHFNAVNMPPARPGTDASRHFREEHIRIHRKGSARIDLEEFSDSVKGRIRAHYSALVAMIDIQVGAILKALDRRQDGRETIVILSADHGDFLGDFDLIGKDIFFESAMHVPLIVRAPTAEPGMRSGSLVTVTDLFATILAAAGLPNATGSDSICVAAIDPLAPRRTYALGALCNGVAMDDGRFRLARYSDGHATLFDLRDDPDEQRNLIADSAYDAVRAGLDARLNAEIVKSALAGNQEKRYPYMTMSPDHPGNSRGWSRTYPHVPESSAAQPTSGGA